MRWPKVALIVSGAVLAGAFLYASASAALASRPGPVPEPGRPVGLASLTVTITSLPGWAFGDVTVTGPEFYFRYVPRSATLRGLRPGTYVVHAGPVRVRTGVQYPVTPEVSVPLQPGSHGAVQVSYADTIPSTTKILGASSVTGLSGSPGGPQTLTLSSLPGGLAVGDVVAVGITQATPDGLLGKVTAFTNNGTGYSVSTAPATLEEAMPEGVIDPSWTEPSQDESLDDSGLSCGAGASLSVTDQLSLTPGFEFSGQWGVNGAPPSATFEASATLTEQLQAAVAGAASCKIDNQPLIAPIYFPRFTIFIGEVPLVVRPFLDFDLSAEVSTNASLTEGATLTDTPTAGLDYANGQLTPVASPGTPKFTPQVPTPDLQADLSASVGPTFGLLLYGAAGPEVNVAGSLALEVTPGGSPAWTLTGGLDAGAGLAVPILDIDESDPSIISNSVDLDTSPPAISTTPLSPGIVGTSYSQTLAASDGTPPYQWSVSSGGLLPGLSLDATTGTISGTPTQSGSYSFTIQVTDASVSVLNPDGQTAAAQETITVSSGGGHLYWGDAGPAGASVGTIMAANLDGTGVTTLVTGQNSPFGVAVDGSHIYWADTLAGTIMEANLDGTGVTTLVNSQIFPFGVAVDGSHIYWTDFADSGQAANGTVMAANLDGTGVTTLATGQNGPWGVAVDGSHIYWADSFAGTIMEANLDGTGMTALLSGQNDPTGVAVDSSHIYWTDAGLNTVNEANLDGTGVTTLVTDQNGPLWVAVDSSHIYWTDANAGLVMEANLDGTGMTTLATGQNDPLGVAVGP